MFKWITKLFEVVASTKWKVTKGPVVGRYHLKKWYSDVGLYLCEKSDNLSNIKEYLVWLGVDLNEVDTSDVHPDDWS